LRGIHLASTFALTFGVLTPTLGASAPATSAQDDTAIKAELTIHTDQPQWKIDRRIYGQFAEHLGHGIYGGLWVGEDSPIPNTRGLRLHGGTRGFDKVVWKIDHVTGGKTAGVLLLCQTRR
jgi:alpha-N-arabinofuranosidase